MKFSKELQKWRGNRSHRVSSELLGIKIKTLQSWEYAAREPNPLALVEIRRRMAANPEQNDIKTT